MTYLITFACYGRWLHGDSRGSTLRGFGDLAADPALERYERSLLVEPPYELADPHRVAIRDSIIQTAQFGGWYLVATHVRQDHVHIVADIDIDPSVALRDFKANASRRLREHGLDPDRKKRWARSGNVARLSESRAVQDAVTYCHRKSRVAHGLLSGSRLAAKGDLVMPAREALRVSVTEASLW